MYAYQAEAVLLKAKSRCGIAFELSVDVEPMHYDVVYENGDEVEGSITAVRLHPESLIPVVCWWVCWVEITESRWATWCGNLPGIGHWLLRRRWSRLIIEYLDEFDW